MHRFPSRPVAALLLACLPLLASAASRSASSEETTLLRQQRQTQRQDIEQAMRNAGGRDSDWAAATRQQLSQSMATLRDDRTRLVELDCAANYCRLVLTHSGIAAQQDMLERTAGKPGFSLPGMAHLENNEDGTAVTYVYLRNPAVEWPVHPAS